MGTFAERTRELEDRVGDGVLEGRVSYGPEKIAVPQHEGTWASGPNAGAIIKRWTTPGTGPKYLETPLLAGQAGFLQTLATLALEPGGLMAGMVSDMELLGTAANQRIPKDQKNLVRSQEVRVFDNGALAYQRAG